MEEKGWKEVAERGKKSGEGLMKTKGGRRREVREEERRREERERESEFVYSVFSCSCYPQEETSLTSGMPTSRSPQLSSLYLCHSARTSRERGGRRFEPSASSTRWWRSPRTTLHRFTSCNPPPSLLLPPSLPPPSSPCQVYGWPPPSHQGVAARLLTGRNASEEGERREGRGKFVDELNQQGMQRGAEAYEPVREPRRLAS
eukprot:757563-Hanusia_phi.AAC.2